MTLAVKLLLIAALVLGIIIRIRNISSGREIKKTL